MNISLISKTNYREITESIPCIQNTELQITIARLFIRYAVRLTGYSNSIRILKKITEYFKFNSGSKRSEYIFSLFLFNKYKIQSLQALSKEEIDEYISVMISWGEDILKYSLSAQSRWTARKYLSLLSVDGQYDKSTRKVGTIFKEFNKREKFYIYGPNASEPPSVKYKDHIIVLTKPIDIDLKPFKGSILFLNDIFYSKKVEGNQKFINQLLKKYDQIFISSRNVDIVEPFKRSLFPIGSSFASPMALPRIIYNLKREYEIIESIIDGYDLYLERESYKKYYPTLLRQKDMQLNEKMICQSLADHDPLYNFLYVKELNSQIEIIESDNFKNLMKLSGSEYLEKLVQCRDFRLIKV